MNIIQFIKWKVDIRKHIDRYTNLKAVKGSNYLKSTCPICDCSSLAFTVCLKNELYYCYRCHKGGDVITFTSLLNGSTAFDAILFLIFEYDIEMPEDMLQKLNDLEPE